MAPFHPYERRDLSGVKTALDVICRERELEGVRVTLKHLIDNINLLECGADCFLALHCRGYINRPELPAEPSLPQARDVGVELGLRLADIQFGEVALHLLSVLPGQIIMTID